MKKVNAMMGMDGGGDKGPAPSHTPKPPPKSGPPLTVPSGSDLQAQYSIGPLNQGQQQMSPETAALLQMFSQGGR